MSSFDEKDVVFLCSTGFLTFLYFERKKKLPDYQNTDMQTCNEAFGINVSTDWDGFLKYNTFDDTILQVMSFRLLKEQGLVVVPNATDESTSTE